MPGAGHCWPLALTPGAAAGPVGRVVVFPQTVDETEAVVCDARGKRVGTRCLGAGKGQPLEVWFDAAITGEAPRVYVGRNLGVAPWDPPAGLMLEVRSRPPGPVDTVPQILALWDQAGTVQGRGWQGRIFLGANPFGPSVDLLARFTGWFTVATAGDYELALVSSGGSVVSVDKNQVVAWPGWHGPEGGLRGERHGRVTLSAGRHRLDYLMAQPDSGLTAMLAWKPPGATAWQPMPESAFAGVAPWRAVTAETPAGPDPLAIRWQIAGHVAPAGELAEPSLVLMRLGLATPLPGRTLRWRFADGETATGDDAGHWWLAPGLRDVVVELADPPVLSRTVAVAVRPAWTQVDPIPSAWSGQWRPVLTGRDLARGPAEDFAAALRLVTAGDEPALTGKFLDGNPNPSPGLAQRFPDALLKFALLIQGAEVRRYRESAAWLRVLADTPGVPPGFVAKARLHLGGHRLHLEGDATGATALWNQLEVSALEPEDRRLLGIFRADALLLAGDSAAAQRAYRAVGTVVQADDREYVMRRRLRLELARDRLAQGNWEEAAKTLKDLEWETPLERQGHETAPLLMRLWLARGELARARVRGRMLCQGDDGPRTPEILLLAAKIELAGGDVAAAERLVKRLRTDHPFSEAAAAARDLITSAKPRGTP